MGMPTPMQYGGGALAAHIMRAAQTSHWQYFLAVPVR